MICVIVPTLAHALKGLVTRWHDSRRNYVGGNILTVRTRYACSPGDRRALVPHPMLTSCVYPASKSERIEGERWKSKMADGRKWILWLEGHWLSAVKDLSYLCFKYSKWALTQWHKNHCITRVRQKDYFIRTWSIVASWDLHLCSSIFCSPPHYPHSILAKLPSMPITPYQQPPLHTHNHMQLLLDGAHPFISILCTANWDTNE